MLDPNQIRQAREALSLSQRELARRAGISRTALNQLEQGKVTPGPHFSRKLRDFFEVAGMGVTAPGRINTPQPAALVEATTSDEGIVEPEQETDPTLEESEDDGLADGLVILLGLGLSLILGRRVGG